MSVQAVDTKRLVGINFGFVGIQYVFALLSAYTSYIFIVGGSSVEELSWFWLVAPISGAVVQPIVGFLTDTYKGGRGKWIVFIVVGMLLTAVSMVLLPLLHYYSDLPSLLPSVILIALINIGINIMMKPFRSMIADLFPKDLHAKAFSIQTLLIGFGAVLGSILPFVVASFAGSAGNVFSMGVALSLYVGAFFLIISVLVTTRACKNIPDLLVNNEESDGGATDSDAKKALVRLLPVQFFSWGAFFIMWVYASTVVGAKEYSFTLWSSSSEAWVGLLFGIYNAVSVLMSIFLYRSGTTSNLSRIYLISLILGAVSFFVFGLANNQIYEILSMFGIGIAWASILSVPYVYLSRRLPHKRLGLYVGLFNLTITLPQIVVGLLLPIFITKGLLLPGSVILLSAVMLLLAGVFSLGCRFTAIRQ
ncbi:MAG: MFS transporter [Bacteroidales bacterium]